MAEVAFASGFSSVRQFNDTVRAVFALPDDCAAREPTSDASRRQRRQRVWPLTAAGDRAAPGRTGPAPPFRQPLAPENLFGHLAATAVPGVEEVRNGAYRRTLRLAHGPGVVDLRPTPSHVACRVVLSDLRDLPSAIARCRWLLDLDADPVAIDELLGADPELAPAGGQGAGPAACRAASTGESSPFGP